MIIYMHTQNFVLLGWLFYPKMGILVLCTFLHESVLCKKNRQKGSICHMVLCCSHNFLSKNKQLCAKRNHIILWIILCMFTLLGIPSKNVHWLYQSKSHALIWNTGLLVIWLSKLFDDEHCWRGIIFRNAHPLH